MSIHINLLDWRKARRERLKKEFTSKLGLGMVAAGGVIVAGWLVVNGQLEHQKARNQYLQTQIKEMEVKITEIDELERVRSNLLARMQVIEDLQASRTASVHFFDELVNTLPEGVNLTGLKQAGAQVTLDGVAESNGRISTYMKNLDASPWFSEPKLVVIKTVDKGARRKAEFQLQVKKLIQPKQPRPEEAPAGEVESGEVSE
ncbi:MAG TPA: PilN domain-containing protein [Fontimonas sp.]